MAKSLAPREANCEHGDVDGHDLDTYSGEKCGCKRCPSFEIRKMWAPP
jgi:hypothetical protein